MQCTYFDPKQTVGHKLILMFLVDITTQNWTKNANAQ